MSQPKEFMGDDFLLSCGLSRHLYEDGAKNLPIVDYHCHLDPKEIFENRPYENLTQVWLYGDHYKWRQMRAAGEDERRITGDGSDREKFDAYVRTMEKAAGNPLYHWSHMELRQFFGIREILCRQNADAIWEKSLECFRSDRGNLSPRGLMKRSRVEIVCTTDDPADDLFWHKKLAEENRSGSFGIKVLPTFRPDAAMKIESNGFSAYISRLSEVSGSSIGSYRELIDALEKRMEYFCALGCRISDHGFEVLHAIPASGEKLDEIFQKKLSGQSLTAEEMDAYHFAFLCDLGRLAAKHDITMQIHMGVMRDVNQTISDSFGPDGGVDAIGRRNSPEDLGAFLNLLAAEDALPQMILYSLRPEDNVWMDTVIGCFGNKVRHGAAWWFNDHLDGIRSQLSSMAALNLLGNSLGMLTDSRSFLSYARHDYFRRIFCDLLGSAADRGELPAEDFVLMPLVHGVCHDNAAEFFRFF